MASPPQGWKQGDQPNIYEANIKQINISTGTVSLVGETNKSNGSYTVYSTSGINYSGGRSPLYTVSSSGARTVQDTSTYNQLQQSGEIEKLDSSIKPKAFEINKAFGTQPEKQAVASSTLYKSLANTAQTPQPPDQQAAIPTGKTETVPSIETVELKDKQLRIAPDSGLTYPLNRKPTQDRIKFQAYKILPRTGQSQASSTTNLEFRFGQRNYESVDGPVFLSIQAGISDQNGVDWGPDNINAIDAALYNASINLMQTDTGQQLGDKVGDLAGQIQGELRNIGGKFGRYLAGQAAGINNVLARTDNIVLNPNLELLFQGPQLRPFSFQFKMSAREKPEAEQVKKIVKYFKYHMVPRQETAGLFLKAPNVFKIEYQYGASTPHPGLNLIKECALTNCSVDYTPLGSYATYEDGTMVAYTLSLQFQEITPIYDSDYTDAQSIGY